jgi:ubiquinone/menaquinone biosynthesis C-methylase UbiE
MSCCNNNAEDLHKITQDYYGKQLQGSKDLKTNCCKCSEKPPKYIREAISLLHEDIISHYYGCGLVIPDLLEGLTCLDLGCGAGHDVYILSKLVGEKGKVYGVDMTEEQLNIAEKYKEYQTKVYGYSKPNVEFIKGYIENLEAIPDNSIDLIVSNCVVNLSPNKKDVFKEAYRVLKPGGEMYFSDVYSDRRIPEKLLHDPILHGECLSGALYWNDFLSLVKTVGFKSPRLVKDRPLSITNKDIEKLIGFAKFYSATYRLFKIPEFDNTDGEDYGLKIKYKGTIETCPDIFILDKENKFETGKEYNICGNTYRILNESRFRKHFEFYGNFEIHYGIMNNCSSMFPFNKEKCCMESENMNDMENNDNTYEDNYYYQYGPWDYNYYGYNHDNYYY